MNLTINKKTVILSVATVVISLLLSLVYIYYQYSIYNGDRFNNGIQKANLPDNIITPNNNLYIIGSNDYLFKVSKKSYKSLNISKMMLNDDIILNNNQFSNYDVYEDVGFYYVKPKYKIRPSTNNISLIAVNGTNISKQVKVDYAYNKDHNKFDETTWDIKPIGWLANTDAGIYLKRPSNKELSSLIFLRKFYTHYKFKVSFIPNGNRINLYARYKFNKSFSIGAGGNRVIELIDRSKMVERKTLSKPLVAGLRYVLVIEKINGRIIFNLFQDNFSLCTYEVNDSDVSGASLGLYLYNNSDDVIIDEISISSNDRG